MKAVQIKGYGGDEVVEINRNAIKSSPKAGMILVEVRAAGVNPMDWKVRDGLTKNWIKLQFPATIGLDFSGVVAEIGEGVTGFRKGNEVYGQTRLSNGGSFAEFILVDTGAVAIKPKNISHIEAAALPLAGVSAYQGIIELLNLSPNQKILVHGGAGGIGSFAIQFAKHMGAYVAATVRGQEVDFAKKLGADLVIDFEKQRFEDHVKEYDAVFDTVGGDTYTRSYSVLRVGGVVLSMLESPKPDLMKQYNVNAIYESTQVNTERLNKLADYADKSAIKVYVDKVYPLDRAAEALTYLKEGHPHGKVVIEIQARIPSEVKR